MSIIKSGFMKPELYKYLVVGTNVELTLNGKNFMVILNGKNSYSYVG